MKNKIWGLVVIGLFLFTSLAFAGTETIKDDNDGNKGNILINTGTQQGNNDVGHWTDITTIPELKGEKGDIGTNGLDGYTPIKNVDYFDGINGLNGIDGLSIKGDKGDKGDNGLDFDPAEVIRLDGKIDTETTNRIKGDNKLNKKINKINNNSIDRDIVLQDNINVVKDDLNIETKQRKQADKAEKRARILGDKKLQNNINTVDTNSKNRDTTLQNNINNEALTRFNEDTSLNNRITDVANFNNYINERQDRTLANHESRLNNHEGRLGKLEETQFNIRGEVQFIREKNFTVGVYGKYNTNRQVCSEVGLSITIGIGKSWTEREIDKVNDKVAKLEALIQKQLERAGGEDVKVIKTENNNGSTTFSIDMDGTAKVLKRF